MSNLIQETGKPIQLGIVGFSEGNGHPYSWSAIFNGYDSRSLHATDYPQIADYLDKQIWPKDQIHEADVVSVFCDDAERAMSVAQCARIPSVSKSIEELVQQSDAILLARDDATSRKTLLEKIILSGKPVFVDKPFALSLSDAERMFELQNNSAQIFTTSALRYAKELLLTPEELHSLGELQSIYAVTPKYWCTYAVHLLEVLMAQWGGAEVRSVYAFSMVQKGSHCHFYLDDILVTVQVVGQCKSPIKIEYQGTHQRIVKTFTDSFSCFKTSLQVALQQWKTGEIMIPRSETLKVCELLQAPQGECLYAG